MKDRTPARRVQRARELPDGGPLPEGGFGGVATHTHLEADVTDLGPYVDLISAPTVTGSRGGNAALASLLAALVTYGLIVDSSSA